MVLIGTDKNLVNVHEIQKCDDDNDVFADCDENCEECQFNGGTRLCREVPSTSGYRLEESDIIRHPTE